LNDSYVFQSLTWRRRVQIRWDNFLLRAFPLVHRAYDLGDRPRHLAIWRLTGPDVIVYNPWWNVRWLMEARSCRSCHEMRTRVIGWRT
jgi:hypothetical protein